MPRWYSGRDIARPAYYDRDAIPVVREFVQTLTPHGGTIRISYATAFPYAAFMEVIVTRLTRQSQGSVANTANGYWEFHTFYGESALLSAPQFNNNTLGTQAGDTIPQLGYMAFGDFVTFTTFDLSTGGSVLFVGALKGTEFLY